MRARIEIKAGMACAVVLLLWGAGVRPLAAAGREQKIIETAPRTSTVASNLPGRFVLPTMPEEDRQNPFSPEMSGPRLEMPPLPPRQQLPSERVREMRAQKQNWALYEPSKAIGSETADDMLKRVMSDTPGLDVAPKGSVANYFQARDQEQQDAQEAALNELLSSDTEESDRRSDRNGNSRNAFKSPQPELLAPLNQVTVNGTRNPFLVDRLSGRSSPPSERANPYREWLERAPASRIAAPSKPPLGDQSRPEPPAHAIADLGVRPAFSSTSADASFKPVDPAVRQFAPFGNPEALRSQTGVAPANPGLPPTMVRPFAPLPKRNF